MNYYLALSILIIGASGLIAQVILLRELLISFQGNELTIGIILANWLVSEAIGVIVFGKIIDKARNKIGAFIILQVIFSLSLPVSLYLVRTFKYYLGMPVQENIGLPLIFTASLAAVLIPAFAHCALFSCGCKINSLYSKQQPARSIAGIYALETAGTIIGGIILTYLLLTRLNSFQIVLSLSLLNLLICLLFIRVQPNRPLNYAVFICAGIVFYLFCGPGIDKLQEFSVNKQFKPGRIWAYNNSVYGNVTLTKNRNQYTLFYNGSPSITLPQGDITFIEEFGQLPLLFHNNPKQILIISSGMGGLINEILKYPVKNIDYIELDPLVIKTVKQSGSELITRELNNPRVKVFNTDAMVFIRNTIDKSRPFQQHTSFSQTASSFEKGRDKYDIILIGLSKPADLSSNRFFTSEFFSLLKKKINPEGIVAFSLPGSLTYISNELKNLNACILNAARENYAYIRIIPGDYNIFLASDSEAIMKVTPEMIVYKMNESAIKTNLLIPDYLNYRLDTKWVRWFKQSLSDATININQNSRPFAVFQMLILWNKQFSHRISDILNNLGNLNIKQILSLIIILALSMFFISKLYPKLTCLNIAYSIMTTGFSGMMINLILIFSFQISHGYLYQAIGLLISLFMAGASIGSIIIMSYNNKNPLKIFLWIEAIVIIFSFTAAIMTTAFSGLPYSIFLLLFIITGTLVGSQFSLAGKIYLTNNRQIGETAGTLYFSDLIGGCIAGIIGGVLFLPVLGLFNSCIVIISLKLTSLSFLILSKKTKK